MSVQRPFLVLRDAQSVATGSWVPSPGNLWWRPSGSYYPDVSQLQPGDLLLFAPLDPDRGQRFIAGFQMDRGAEPGHARFTHAAIYAGMDHIVCESVPVHGVRYASLERRLENNACLVRRWPGLTSEQSGTIAFQASKELGRKYGWPAAVLEKIKKGWGTRWDQDGEAGLVCSRLCDRSITTALIDLGFPGDQVAIAKGSGEWVTPAVLSASEKLVDVAVKWAGVRPVLDLVY